jgi:hypothetical protein
MSDVHVMLDIETMSTKANAAIVAIGAVKFDEQGLIGEGFYRNVYLKSSLRAGLEVSGDTVMWWLDQSAEARASLSTPEPVRLELALQSFVHYTGQEDVKLWGNGAAFDNPRIINALEHADVLHPYKFWNDRCYRTIKGMFPLVGMRRSGVHHHALADAKSQALHLIEIVRINKLRLN